MVLRLSRFKSAMSRYIGWMTFILVLQHLFSHSIVAVLRHFLVHVVKPRHFFLKTFSLLVEF